LARCKVDEEYIQSDRLPIYYENAERLLRTETLTFAHASPEEFQKQDNKKHPMSVPKSIAFDIWSGGDKC